MRKGILHQVSGIVTVAQVVHTALVYNPAAVSPQASQSQQPLHCNGPFIAQFVHCPVMDHRLAPATEGRRLHMFLISMNSSFQHLH
jgi:hypothetical protein